MKLLAFLGLCGLYCVLLLAVYMLHVHFLPVQVILYSAVLDAVIAAVLTLLVAVLFRHQLRFSGFEMTLSLLVWLLGGYAFAISGPTVLDRSLSFYILEKLQQRGGGILLDRIGEVFTSEYLPEFRLVDVRITEQVQSGTIVLDKGCVRLTPRGAAIASLSGALRGVALAQHRLLMGTYTDALTRPFSGTETAPRGYEC